MKTMTNQTGNGGSNSPQALAGRRRMDGAISTERLVMLAQATPEQQAQVDAILAGRVPVTAPPEARMALREHDGGEPFLNKKEVAKLLGIKIRTCDSWMQSGRLCFYKVGRSVRFRYSEIQQHLAVTARVCRRSS